MKEAQAMMEDPNFQKNMKQMMQGQGFQDAMSQTNSDLQDPARLKAMEEKAEKAIAEGNVELEEQEKQRRLRVTAAVEQATKERAEAEAAASAGGDNDKKQAAVEEVTAADVEKKEEDVPFALNLNWFEYNIVECSTLLRDDFFELQTDWLRVQRERQCKPATDLCT